MTYARSVVAILMTLGAAPVFAQAAATAPPSGVSGESLRIQLQRDLSQLALKCYPKIDDLHDPAIPSEISSSPDLDNVPFRIAQADLSRIFLYVFTEQKLSHWTSAPAVAKRFLALPPVRPLPTAGEDNYLYVQTCMSLLQGAVEGGFKAKIPAVNLGAALSSEYENSKRQDLAYVRGRFDSPFGAALNGRMTVSDQVHARFAVWSMYVQNPTLSTGGAYYLDHATGWLRTYLFKTARQLRARVQAEAGANWLLASINSSLRAEAQSDQDISGNQYLIWVVPVQGNVTTYDTHFEPIPPASEIRQALENVAQQEIGKNATLHLASVAGRQEHRQVIYGLPVIDCDRNRWVLNPALSEPRKGRVEITSVDTAQGRCEFSVRYTYSWPAIEEEVRSTGEVVLNYSLEYKSKVQQPGAQAQTLVVKAVARILGAVEPRITPLEGGVIARFSNADSVLSFRAPLELYHSQVNIALDSFGAGGRAAGVQGSLTCADRATPVRVWVSRRSAGVFEAEGEQSLAGGALPKVNRCVVKATIPVPLMSGIITQRPIEVILTNVAFPPAETLPVTQ
ncbi:MAG TPA: hypothetical protein VGB15_15280 [Longimicrobium sp.]|jgi:hypothetical protein